MNQIFSSYKTIDCMLATSVSKPLRNESEINYLFRRTTVAFARFNLFMQIIWHAKCRKLSKRFARIVTDCC